VGVDKGLILAFSGREERHIPKTAPSSGELGEEAGHAGLCSNQKEFKLEKL